MSDENGAPFDEASQEGSSGEEIRRILVAVDASPHSLTALRAAAQMATGLGAELVGVFVEDIHLIRISELPLAREYSVFSATPRQMDRSQIEQQLRTLARRARREMEVIARQSRLRWSFQVVRGIITSELLAAASESDLIIVGKAGWSRRRRRMGSTARAVLTQAPRYVLVIQQGAHIGLPVGLIFDGSPASWRAFHFALQLLQHREGFLTVFILSPDVDKARQLQSEIRQQVIEHRVHIHYRWLIHTSIERLSEVIQVENSGLMMVPGDSEELNGLALGELCERLDMPVLVVR
jgi:nucleotide-binding universal stress UspA family protein